MNEQNFDIHLFKRYDPVSVNIITKAFLCSFSPWKLSSASKQMCILCVVHFNKRQASLLKILGPFLVPVLKNVCNLVICLIYFPLNAACTFNLMILFGELLHWPECLRSQWCSDSTPLMFTDSLGQNEIKLSLWIKSLIMKWKQGIMKLF